MAEPTAGAARRSAKRLGLKCPTYIWAWCLVLWAVGHNLPLVLAVIFHGLRPRLQVLMSLVSRFGKLHVRVEAQLPGCFAHQESHEIGPCILSAKQMERWVRNKSQAFEATLQPAQ